MLGMAGGILFLTAALGAANALFGIASPAPVAHAQASLKSAPSSNQVAVDHVAPQTLQAGGPAANSPDQSSGNNAVGRKRQPLIRQKRRQTAKPKSCWCTAKPKSW